MEDNNNQSLDNQNDSKNANYSQSLDFCNQSSNNDSAPFHEFEHRSFNTTKLEEEFGEIKKKLYSSKLNLLI